MSAEKGVPASAHRKRRRWSSPIWLVPLGAAALAAYVFHRKFAEEGPKIEIVFHDASGLEAGKTDVDFLGVKVGDLIKLRISEDHKDVIGEVRLLAEDGDLAREGTTFWVVRPRLSAGSIQALGTIVSGDYIELKPGRGKSADRFIALTQPPIEKTDKRDLELILVTDRLGAMEQGTPIFYRGFQVGQVNDSRLSDDARQIRIRAFIDEQYRDLVRQNSQFWNVGGVQARFSLLHGLQVRAKSVNTLVSGGLAFATPDAPGPPVKDGQTFPINEKSKDEWLKWNPAIKIHSTPRDQPSGPPPESAPSGGSH